ncbi:MAG: hypothetical protein ACREA4_12030, partial [Nitrososphaera sp.]
MMLLPKIEKIRNEEIFQKLCNAMLKREFSISVIALGAKGRDDAIDSFFEGTPLMGTLGDKTGTWTFQFKFVNPVTDPSRARQRVITALKSELRKEVLINSGINHYLFITNVKLTSGNYKKIKALSVGISFSISVWNGADIEASLNSHPDLLQT